ncbi:unnamed protein product [Mesocestoides corti]|uniref:Transmembrane protein 33 n=1 Tax=Mesocestoides corti TaxID=53468 RepID=A0A0R3U3C9_MESCO|nr:unnamed protein product [Mesocestoides corti]
MSNWSSTLTYCTRLVTLFSCISYVLSLLLSSGGNAFVWYQRALIANAATSALRLRQRIVEQGSQLHLTQQSLLQLISEDSLHYLLYSVMFLLAPPVTVAIVPIFCFAFLHCLGFTQNLLQLYAGETSSTPSWASKVRSLISKAQNHGVNLLRVVAIHEILLMVVAIVLAFSGRNLLLPFFYYHFLKLRYASRRNPYCRSVCKSSFIRARVRLSV